MADSRRARAVPRTAVRPSIHWLYDWKVALRMLTDRPLVDELTADADDPLHDVDLQGTDDA